MMYRVGITGLIGSGKSQAAQYFSQLGVTIVDTDLISHQLTAPNGLAIASIEKNLGGKYVNSNGQLDRELLRREVFADDNLRNSLEQILHPMIFDIVSKQVDNSDSFYTIIVVPLLFKVPLYCNYVDKSIFVDCDEGIIKNRVMERSNLSDMDINAILNAQMRREEQLKLADDIITNNYGLDELKHQVIELHKKYKKFILSQTTA